MELPNELRMAVEQAADGIPQRELAALTGALSQRYRTQSGAGLRLLSRDAEAVAYAATRMPATYAAVRTALDAALSACDEPLSTLLDVGAGTGAGSWAAAYALDGLRSVTCLEREEAMIGLGQRLMAGSDTFDGVTVEWVRADMTAYAPAQQYDLVIASYMMNELTDEARAALLERLWAATGRMLLVIEPGTPVGYAQLRLARRRVLDWGGHVAAPCPHADECPITGDDWCHFTCRVARTRLHRQLKGGDAPYEDEKFAYMAFTRAPGNPCAARVRRHPKIESGRITLELCARNGLESRVVTKRDGALFKAARKADCGDAW